MLRSMGVEQQGGDVPKLDAGLGEIRDRSDQRAKILIAGAHLSSPDRDRVRLAAS
jgi:hypothetical protein